jgi:hypothetical protein
MRRRCNHLDLVAASSHFVNQFSRILSAASQLGRSVHRGDKKLAHGQSTHIEIGLSKKLFAARPNAGVQGDGAAQSEVVRSAPPRFGFAALFSGFES